MLEQTTSDFRERITASFARQGAMALIGAELTRIEQGTVEIELGYRPDLTQQHGFLHAGVISAALDSACTYAAYTMIDADVSILTIEFKLNMLSPGKGKRFLFRGEITKPGSNIIVADGRGYAIDQGPAKLIASMTGTKMAIRGREDIQGMSDRLKMVAGKAILFVMAAEAEYGPHLRAMFTPVMTGVGPVEAAIVLTQVLSQLSFDGRKPDLVVSLGSAGSAVLEQAAVYQATSVAYRDMDASPFGFEKGVTPFLGLPAVLPLPIRIPGVAEARISTGANIVSGAAYGAIDAEMVDMETFAVARACMAFGIPLVGLRGISDGRVEVNHIDDWTEYLHVIDERLARAVGQLEQAIAGGTIAF